MKSRLAYRRLKTCGKGTTGSRPRRRSGNGVTRTTSCEGLASHLQDPGHCVPTPDHKLACFPDEVQLVVKQFLDGRAGALILLFVGQLLVIYDVGGSELLAAVARLPHRLELGQHAERVRDAVERVDERDELGAAQMRVLGGVLVKLVQDLERSAIALGLDLAPQPALVAIVKPLY